MAGRETIVIDDFFVPTEHGGHGKLNPHSYALGQFVLEQFELEWLGVQVPDGFFARVSVYCTMTDDGVKGYSIRKEIVPCKLVPDRGTVQ